jgi:hypothetical protein
MDGLSPTTVMTGVMFANIVVHDEAHRGFRAIHKMNNIRSLSGVIWGNAWVIGGIAGKSGQHPASAAAC